MVSVLGQEKLLVSIDIHPNSNTCFAGTTYSLWSLKLDNCCTVELIKCASRSSIYFDCIHCIWNVQCLPNLMRHMADKYQQKIIQYIIYLTCQRGPHTCTLSVACLILGTERQPSKILILSLIFYRQDLQIATTILFDQFQSSTFFKHVFNENKQKQ